MVFPPPRIPHLPPPLDKQSHISYNLKGGEKLERIDKVKIAFYNFYCEECYCAIQKDDEFYFIQDGDGGCVKICPNCYNALFET